MSGPKLFEPFHVGDLSLDNRIVIAPMCQYSAVDGEMTDWHLIHLGQLALSGAALLTIEASAVLPEGRISHADVGLWDDRTEAAMKRVLDGVRAHSDMPIAIQLGHAGRKASTHVPWEGGAQIAPDSPNGWQTVAPSALPFTPGTHAPTALDKVPHEPPGWMRRRPGACSPYAICKRKATTWPCGSRMNWSWTRRSPKHWPRRCAPIF